jgi:hypothetical protein
LIRVDFRRATTDACTGRGRTDLDGAKGEPVFAVAAFVASRSGSNCLPFNTARARLPWPYRIQSQAPTRFLFDTFRASNGATRGSANRPVGIIPKSSRQSSDCSASSLGQPPYERSAAKARSRWSSGPWEMTGGEYTPAPSGDTPQRGGRKKSRISRTGKIVLPVPQHDDPKKAARPELNEVAVLVRPCEPQRLAKSPVQASPSTERLRWHRPLPSV